MTSLPFGDFHDRTDHSSVSALLHTREITMLSLSESPSNFYIDKVRTKETGKEEKRKGMINKEDKIERMKDKRTKRKCHTETEYGWLLIGF